MTGATFCIGLLPVYLAIGLAAPILLLLLLSLIHICSIDSDTSIQRQDDAGNFPKDILFS